MRLPPRALLLVVLVLGLTVLFVARSGFSRRVEASAPRSAARDDAARAVSGGPLADRPALARQVLLERLAYSQSWDAPQPPALAAFHDWAGRYRGAGTVAARQALEAEGLALARARRPAMLEMIRQDPQRALAATVPAALRQILPAPIVAELETRVAGRGDSIITVATYAPGAAHGPAVQRVASINRATYLVHTYGRREAQLTKEGASLHGIVLDGELALHESPLRLLDPGEILPAATAPVCPVSGEVVVPLTPSDAANLATLDVAEANGQIWEFCGGGMMVETFEAKLTGAEAGSDPRVRALSPGGQETSITAAAAGTSHTLGVQKLLVVRVDFSDFPGDPLPGVNVQAMLDSNVSPQIDAMSYGRTSLATTLAPKIYRLAQSGATYALTDPNQTLIKADTRAAVASDYSFTDFDRIEIIFRNLNAPAVANSTYTFAGTGELGGTTIITNGISAFSDFTSLCHEFGHTYGNLHASLWKVTDGNPVSAAGTSIEYGDPFDIMSTSAVTNVTRDARTHFNPWFKNRLGWLPDAAVTDVTTSGTYRIYRFDSKSSPVSQPLALRIFRDGVRSYWVGLRQNYATGTPTANGAYVIWGYNNNQQSMLLDLTTPGTSANDAALAVGSTFSDPAYGITIKPSARGGTEPAQWLDVDVTVPAAPANVVSAWGREGPSFFSETFNTGTVAPVANEANVPMGLTDVQAIVAGDSHVLAMKTDGTLVAWGDNTYNETTIPPGLNGNVTAIAAGANVSGAVKRDGTVQIWGDATSPIVANLPAGLNGVKKLALGSDHALALKTDGTVVAWGANALGQTNVPATLANVVAIAAGKTISIALNAQGAVTRWGANFAGVAFPAGLNGVTAISACGAVSGGQFALALKSDGTVVAWGSNVSNQSTIPPGLTGVIAVAAGAFHSLALKSDGSVVCWGSDSNGQLDAPGGLRRSYALAATSRASLALTGPHFYLIGSPQPQSVPASTTATFTVAATGASALSYQWRKNGVAIPGATGSTLTLANVGSGDAGNYDAVVTDAGSASSYTSGSAALVVTAAPPGALVTSGRLINLSILTPLAAGETMTLGTVLGGAGTAGSKGLLVRAAGPSLTPLGVVGALVDPKLDFFSGPAVIASNNDWGGTPALTDAFLQVGAFAFVSATSKDAAVYNPSLAAGSYTVQVNGTGSTGGTVIAELYDSTPASTFTATTPRLINVSVLKQIDAGQTLIAGFVIGGTTPVKVLIRAVAPTLSALPFGLGGMMPDPKLDLYSGPTVIKSNDDWGSDASGVAALTSAFTNVGAFAYSSPASKDAALLVTLAPGSYTAQVSGATGTGGRALVEVYEVP